jgi:hypothetical protein
MKKTILFGLLVFASLGNAQNYTFTSTTANYADLIGSTSINNGVIWDDNEFNITLPYNIKVNGVDLNSFIVSDSFIIGNTTSNIKQYVSPLGADLLDRGDISGTSQSPLSYKTEGSVGNRITKIEFKNCGSYNDSSLLMFANFQIWLYETSNIIEFRYGPSSITNSSVFYAGDTGGLIGIVNYDGPTEELLITYLLSGNPSNPTISTTNTIVYLNGTPAPNTVYRFTPAVSLSTSDFEKSAVSAYPNPAEDVLNFDTKENLNIQSVEIYNMMGQVVLSDPNATTSINVSSLTNGNYYVKVNTEKGIVNTKFIKK